MARAKALQLDAGRKPRTSGSGAPAAVDLRGRSLVLCVTGSVAAYKAAELVRLLLAAGADVEVALSPGAARFVGAATFSGLTGKPVHVDMFDAPGELHVALARKSDAVVIAPATADVIARIAAGRASDLVTALALTATCPLVIAPAMHPSMWRNAQTQRNVARLGEDARVRFVGPVEGPVASGDVGVGRMQDPSGIVTAAFEAVARGDLSGLRLVVTAGPTVEDIDPVRFVSNRSSGKMGFAIAERAAARGAVVTLVAGPVTLPTPRGVHRVDVRSAREMRDVVQRALRGADALVMSAAVGDFRPSEQLDRKLKRGSQGLRLELVQNPDILAEIGAARRGSRPLLVGFAVETATGVELVQLARRKLASKRVDLVVANAAADSLGRDDNRATLVSAKAATALPQMSKRELAEQILGWIGARLGTRASRPSPRRRRPHRPKSS